jgi:integrase
MLETGMRPEEVCRNRRENVHLDQGHLFNPFGKTNARHGVSTGSGSDRVSGNDKIEFAKSLTRSLWLPVLTSSVKLGH